MNWVLMLVLLVLVCCAIYGYTKGFLRIVFSLVAWVIVLVFVSWATPHVSQWIQENTTIYEKIEAACEESVRRAAQDIVFPVHIKEAEHGGDSLCDDCRVGGSCGSKPCVHDQYDI